jgi:hypothetical protein
MFDTTVQAELNATLHVCESSIFLGIVPKDSPCILLSTGFVTSVLFVVQEILFRISGFSPFQRRIEETSGNITLVRSSFYR